MPYILSSWLKLPCHIESCCPLRRKQTFSSTLVSLWPLFTQNVTEGIEEYFALSVPRFHSWPPFPYWWPGLPTVRVWPLADPHRRPLRPTHQAWYRRHGHTQTQGSQGRYPSVGQLPGQIVNAWPHLALASFLLSQYKYLVGLYRTVSTNVCQKDWQ